MTEQRDSVRLMQDYISASTYLLFRGEPFAEEDYVAAINEIWDAEKKYNPEFIG